MNDLANKIIKLTNSSSDIIYKELPEDDPKKENQIFHWPKNLNWSPKYDLDEGLIEQLNIL